MKMLKHFLKSSQKHVSKIVAVSSVTALCASSLFTQSYATAKSHTSNEITAFSTSSNYHNYDGITDGTILHAFCWSCNTIRENMKNIYEAGYTAIQTSPINACNGSNTPMNLFGGNDDGSNGAWWWHYQPTDWKIGNYQLGSRSDFIAMCKEADRYGIKIIVDVAPNHTTPDTNSVAQDLKNSAGGNLYHKEGFTPIKNWSNRYECTRGKMGGLPSVDTENTGFQNYFIQYLNDCISCGADGFRYDTAKHIGLPDDDRPAGTNNNFWTRVTKDIKNASDIFNYGEVLQGDNERIDSYISTIGSTCTSEYGKKIRNSVKGSYLNAGDLSGCNYCVGSKNTKNLVTWVESHDNYINDGTWRELDDTQIKLAWAVIAAREEGIPLFYDRPLNGGPSNKWGNNYGQIGKAGSNLYKDASVAAVNKFRTAMAKKHKNGASTGEYLENPNGNSQVLLVRRGNEGVVAINSSYSDYSLVGLKSNLKDGTYNSTNGAGRFVVKNGYYSEGKIPSRGIAVLYNTGDPIPTPTPTPPIPGDNIDIYFKKPNNWNSSLNAYVYNGSGSSTTFYKRWPGVNMSSVGNNVYKVTVPKIYDNGYIIFNDGHTQVPGPMQTGFTIKANGLYDINGYVKQYTQGNTEHKVTIYYKSWSSNQNIHYKVGDGQWTSVPGVRMNDCEYSGYKSYTIDYGNATTVTACFNDGYGNWDNNNRKDYTFDVTSSNVFTVRDGRISNSKPNSNSYSRSYSSIQVSCLFQLPPLAA